MVLKVFGKGGNIEKKVSEMQKIQKYKELVL
jgi:hypothetical protein